MAATVTLMGSRTSRYAITIPANSGNGSTIAALLVAAGYDGPTTGIFVSIEATAPGVTFAARAAFVAASPRPGVALTAIAAADFTTHGEPIDAGAAYSAASDADAASTYVRSATASTITALAKVLG